jgi:sugar lactone lactonase YvrE
MTVQTGRYKAANPAKPAEGWTIERLTPPTRLHGANGLRTGKDGRIYVAQVGGSQISAVNPDTGEIETISAMGSEIIAPDDLCFDDEGNLYVTEITEGRVSMLAPNGTTRVIQGDMPVANPITFHQGRLIAGECNFQARIMELDRNGGAPRVIIDNVPMVNAFEVGPDGKLYFPVMGTNEIWRVSLDGGAPEVVARDLGVPDSVKFDSKGFIVSTQVASGQVLRINPQTGEKTVLADIGPGLDNCTFVGDRLFVSSIPGQISEITAPGEYKALIPGGLQWPMGLAMGADGAMYVADGGFCYTMVPGGPLQQACMLFSPGTPGFVRGVVAAGEGEWVVTSATGAVSRFWPAKFEHEELASGYEELMGVAIAGSAVVFAEHGTGRLLSVEGGNVSELATGLDRPMGVAVDGDGAIYVAERGAGRVVKIKGGKSETVLDGLQQPEGIAIAGSKLYAVDVLSKQLVQLDLGSGARAVLATDLPVGAPVGITPKKLKAFMPLSGAMLPFCGLTAGADGTIYVSGDAEGSVLALRPAA